MKFPNKYFQIFVLSSAIFVVNVSVAEQANKNKMFAEPIVGTVIEKINASNYSYLKVQTKTEQTWVAVPQVNLELNTKVEMSKPIPMFGFESRVLKRKWDRIYFGILTSQKEEAHKNR